ncbi:MAG: DUF1800 domain-containing protein [Terrimicrobiaceae bacterium]|nr:DUF1800 domain-containing protein [Terrimicrobiaceae bacterium]
MLAPLEPTGWTPEAAAHLLNRAGFGGNPKEIADLHALGLDGAVDWLLGAGDDSDLFPPPRASEAEDLKAHQAAQRTRTEEERRQFQQELQRDNRQKIDELRIWWLERMRWSPFAAREKATLFWHGHWATSVEKVPWAFMLWQQNETLRAHALGSFRAMVREISRDPAMMRYLDVVASKRERPNENFARELMELFTLGEGNYSEDDIREAARAFTGYRIDDATQQFFFARRQFDDRPKTFFGTTAAFDGDGIIDRILEEPQCARFLARKLWIYYAGTEPSQDWNETLAAEYRASGYDTGVFLRALFRARGFYAPDVVRRQVKGPVQWLVGTCRMLEMPLPSADVSLGMLRQLGQVLFAPPNVKGWDGGRAWISSATLLLRYNFAGFLVSGRATGLPGIPGRAQPVPLSVETLAGPTPSADEVIERFSWRLFQSQPDPTLRQKFVQFLSTRPPAPETWRDCLHLLMSTPEFQLT